MSDDDDYWDRALQSLLNPSEPPEDYGAHPRLPSYFKTTSRAVRRSARSPVLGRTWQRRSPCPEDDSSLLEYENLWLHRFPGIADPFSCTLKGTEVTVHRRGHQTLREYILSKPAPANEDALRSFASRLARAFYRIHWFRQELRPFNIFCTAAGCPSLVVSVVRDADLKMDAPRPADLEWQLPFLSPQMRSSQNPAGGCPVYSFSALLYLLATGAVPDESRNFALRLRENQSLAASLVSGVLKGLAKWPEERFRSIEEMLVDLWPDLFGTLRADPASLDLALQAEQLRQDGKLVQACSQWKAALKLDPFNPVFKNNLATAVAQLEGWEKAKPYLEEASDGLQAHPGYFVNLGLYNLRLGNLPEARQHLETARALRGASTLINRGLAEILRSEGRLEEAEDELKTAWQNDRGCPFCTALRSTIARQLGRLCEADELSDRAETLARKRGTTNWRTAWPHEDPEGHGPLSGITLPLRERPHWTVEDNDSPPGGNRPVLPHSPPPCLHYKERKAVPR